VAKTQTYYICNSCGKKSLRYMGKCPGCNEWNTMEEVIEQKESSHASRNPVPTAFKSSPQRLKEVSTEQAARYIVPVEEFSRVLGGGIVPGSIILIGGEPGVGKCVTADTRVLDPISGAYLPITEWAKSARPVLSVNDATLALSPDSVTAFYEQGVKPIVEVKTKLGRTLHCTASHPVLTPEGWRPVGELSRGSRIAAPRSLPYFGQDSMSESQLKLIAYILSDGSAQTAISVTNCLPEVFEDLQQIAADFGVHLTTYEKGTSKAKQYRFTVPWSERTELRQEFANNLRTIKANLGISWAEWARKAGVDYWLFRMWRIGRTVPSEADLYRLAKAVNLSPEAVMVTHRDQADKQNAVQRFLDSVGLRFLKAANKRIPACIFRLPREQLSLFLKTLFTCDGSVYVNGDGAPGISYSTISRQLAEDVQHLLLRFGMVATLRLKPMRVNGNPYSAYEIVVLGVSEVKTFLAEIGIMGRETAREQIQQMVMPAGPSTGRDTIPTGEHFWDHLRTVKGELNFAELSRRAGTHLKDRRHERPLCRATVEKLADVLEDPQLHALAYGDVYWDELASITPAGEAMVYDISVEQNANFVANDLIIHNSTLMAQIAALLAQSVGKVLYVSGEESARQIKMRADRLGLVADDLFLVTETSLETIIEHVQTIEPHILIVDSIQTTYSDDKPSSAGTVTQVRECAAKLQMLAKTTGLAVFLVGHVTKEGAIAGPRVLEHIVDTVLYLEGDLFHTYRLLRSVKNRFGATSEVGVFEMRGSGMVEVTNPSEAFLAERVVSASGSAIVVTMEGTRPILVEVQALASPTAYPNPRRTANGVDFNRLQLLTAVLTRRVGIRLAEQDVFVNVIGGMTIDEPAADLAIAVAIASSVWDNPVPADLAIIGEVGLSGELRAVGQLPARLREAAKLGFKRCLIPKTVRQGDPLPSGIEAIPVRSLSDALQYAIPMDKNKKKTPESR
jgi:DNA repair protein RadA/Sms